MVPAVTDLEAKTVELAGILARTRHDHHAPNSEGSPTPAPGDGQQRTAGERRVTIISALDRVLCLLLEAEGAAVAREPAVANDPPGWGDLTPREREVARRLAAGATDRELAGSLGVNLCTAKSHSKAVLAKLRLRSRHELRYVLPASPKG
jgi:DNA-binding CsgD family transcriptional regulator